MCAWRSGRRWAPTACQLPAMFWTSSFTALSVWIGIWRNLLAFAVKVEQTFSSYIEQSVDQRWTRGWKLLMSEHCWRVGRYLLEFIGNNHRLRSECALDFHCFHSELKWLTVWPATQTIITTRRRIGNEFIVIYFWDRPDAEKLISKQKAHSDESRINREVFA